MCQGIRMRTTETDFPKWTLNILLPVGSEFEYKYVIMRQDGSVEWEQCEQNRKISSAEYAFPVLFYGTSTPRLGSHF